MRRSRTRGIKIKELLCLALSLALLLGFIPGRVLAVMDGTEAKEEEAAKVTSDEIEQETEEFPEMPEPEPPQGINPDAEISDPNQEAESEPSLEPDGEDEEGIGPEEESEEPDELEEPEEPEEDETAIYENSISGMLWLDIFEDTDYDIYYGDGIRQPEEEPLAWYPVSLYAADNMANALQTTTTYSDGSYEFTSMEPGEYVVGVRWEIISEAEYLLPLVGISGDNRFIMADDYENAYTDIIIIGEDTVVTDIDAGMRTPPGISPMYTGTFTVVFNLKFLDEYGEPLKNSPWAAYSYNAGRNPQYILDSTGSLGDDGLLNITVVVYDANYSINRTLQARFYILAPNGSTHRYSEGTATFPTGSAPMTATADLSIADVRDSFHFVCGYEWRSSTIGNVTYRVDIGSANIPLIIQMRRSLSITFNSENGTVPPAPTVYWSYEKFDALPTPTRVGCKFEGWYDAPADGNRVYTEDIVGHTFETPADIGVGTATTGTLYAYWSADITEKYVDNTGAPLGFADITTTVPVTTPPETHSFTTPSDKIIVEKDVYEYVGYQVGSIFVAGDEQAGTPNPLTVTESTTVYFVYHKLNTTFDIEYSTTWEFYVDEASWPNIETGEYGTRGKYYTFDNSRSGCAVEIVFAGMSVKEADKLTFVNTEASESPSGSGHISIDLYSAPSTVLSGLSNGFSFSECRIDAAASYNTPMGTLCGTDIVPSEAVSNKGYVTIGGSYSDYLTGSGKYPVMVFTFEFTLIISQEDAFEISLFEESG